MWREERDGIERKSVFGRDVILYKDRPNTFVDLFEHTVRTFPKREALVMDEVRYTYEELWAITETIAANLQEKFQIKQGMRVALLLGNSIEFSLLFLSCIKLGAIVVPLNCRLAAPEISFMVEQAEATLLVTEKAHKEKVNNIKAVKCLVDGEAHGFFSYKELFRRECTPYAKTTIHEEDPLYIMYTSGTTGVPKGAVGTHIGVIHSIISYQRVFQTNHMDRSLIAIPLFHVTGLIGQLFHMIYVGGTNVLMRKYKAEPFNKLLCEEKITFTFNVPTIYVMMLTHPSFKNYSYESLRILAYGGAPMSPQTIYQLKKEFPNVELHNVYGATETSSPATIMPKGYQQKKLASIGLPSPVIEVKIMKGDRRCQAGEVGELWVKGPNVIPKYWNNNNANRLAFVEGYWISGDMAMQDEEGFVYMMDRKKDVINRGGEKIFSIEVENCLYKHPAILEAAVVGVEDDVFGEKVKAVIVLKEGAKLEAEDVKIFVRQHLADYKIPEVIEFCQELPRNPGGKVIKAQLKK